jgi:hypothetical protein
MKPVKKKEPVYVSRDSLDEVVVTPYTKNMYVLEDRLKNKATGGLKPSYPIFDFLAGRGVIKPLKKGASNIVKKAIKGFGKTKVKKAPKKKVLKYRAAQLGLEFKDVNEYTN